MYYTYVIQSEAKDDLYIDSTNNLARALGSHNRGFVSTTLNARPWALIYYEACLDEDDAQRRVKQLRTDPGINDLKQRLSKHFYITEQINPKLGY